LADFGMDENMREDLENMRVNLLEEKFLHVKVVERKFIILSLKIL